MPKIKETPKPIRFTPLKMKGQVLDQVYEDVSYSDLGFIYRRFLQLIELDDGRRWLRLTYYRKPIEGDDSSWVFGGQTSPMMEPQVFLKLIHKAVDKRWINV